MGESAVIEGISVARLNAVVPHTPAEAPGLVIDKVYVGYWFGGRPLILPPALG